MSLWTLKRGWDVQPGNSPCCLSPISTGRGTQSEDNASFIFVNLPRLMCLFPGLMLMYPFSVISVFINIIGFSEIRATSYQFLELKLILETPNVVGVRNESGLLWKLCPQTWYVDPNFLQLGLKVFGRLGNLEGCGFDITVLPTWGNALQVGS